jgi:Zn-finger nucleic acid-binding protein
MTMFTDQELLKLWANDRKRREFAQNYKAWGVWFTQPELDLTFYRYDLPGGGRVLAMEYLREPYQNERHDENEESVANHKFYLQRGKYFNPTAASEHEIAERLKEIKEALNDDRKQREKQCASCGSKCFRHKPDGSVFCAICMNPVR